MKITMIQVQSLDGKLTKGDNTDVHSWSSDEDSTFFMSQLRDARLIVMGRKTFEAAKSKAVPGTLRVVITSQPERFADRTVPGQLEFTSETPEELVARLESAGHNEMLLVGGGQVYGSFFAAHLVTDVYATIEPLLFGAGAEMFGNTMIDTQLELIEVTRLNDRGTLLLKYQVVQP